MKYGWGSWFMGATSHIIGAAFEVHNTLGYGFLEKIYQRAMQVELIKRGGQAELEVPSSEARMFNTKNNPVICLSSVPIRGSI